MFPSRVLLSNHHDLRSSLQLERPTIAHGKRCHHNPSADQINCKNITQQQLLELLLIFVAYCVDILKKAPTSIPGFLSGLKNNLVLRFVELAAFDNSLLVAMKADVKCRCRQQSTPVAVHLPSTSSNKTLNKEAIITV